MKSILEKYSFCNRFSLSGYRGIYNLSEEEAEEVIRTTKERNIKECKRIWDFIKSKEDLPSFEQVIEDIKQEIVNFDAHKFIKEHCPFLLDYMDKEIIEKIGENKYSINSTYKGLIVDTVGQITKYGNEFYHIYATLAEEIDQIEFVKALRNLSDEGQCLIDCNNKYETLKPYIKHKEISFQTHCTISGSLFETYYIELNDVTKKWLLNYKDVFSFDGEPLEDFALYKDNELKFSSCTHEGFSTEGNKED